MKYATQAGTAKDGTRYHHCEGFVRFGANQLSKTIEVKIIDDDTYQDNEFFSIVLSELQVLGGAQVGGQMDSPRVLGGGTGAPKLGTMETRITVLNDDMPGTLCVDAEEVFCNEGSTVMVGIARTHGSCGSITCSYATQPGTACANRDYTPIEGTLVFEDGQVHQTLSIDILKSKDHEFEVDERFKLVLSEPSQGVKFDESTDGGADSAICEVVVLANRPQPWLTRCLQEWGNHDKWKEHIQDYRDQFTSALCCNGSFEDQQGAGISDWFFHCLSLTWKFIFAVVPPPAIGGGWVAFIAALAMIGLVTAIVGDMAGQLGCVMSIPDDITAITLVALGTSLPDTFASKAAAQQDENADNSIGNVTGSNSVNVFLGLGLPWTMAAFFWEPMSTTGVTDEWLSHEFKGKTFEALFGEGGELADYSAGGGFMVPAGSLGFSVTVFTCCALICIGMLVVRRQLYGGELGGPGSSQRRDSGIMTILWGVYIVASIANSLGQAET